MSEDPSTPEPEETPESRPRLRWQYIVLGVGLLLILVGGGYLVFGGPPAEPTPDVPSVEPGADTGFTEAIVGQPELVNPLLATSQADHDLVALVFSGLTRLDDYGQPVPDLAESWEVSPDGLTYTFHLRDDVTWHDGEPFTAGDVDFTFSRLRDPAFTGPADLAAFWRTVETYALDDHTIQFVLTQPLAAFPEYAGIPILPEHLLGAVPVASLADDSFNLAPIGTGRMRWVSSETAADGATVVHLEPYSDYYDNLRRVQLPEMTLRFYNTSSAAFAALGPQAQAMGGLGPSQLNAALGSPNLNIYSARLPVYGAVIFNQQSPDHLPFFQDQGVREALIAALDRPGIIQQAMPRQALPTSTTILPGTWAYDPAVTPIPSDPALAGQLLDAAGWALDGNTRKNGDTTLSFTLLVSDRAADREVGRLIVQQWQAVGVDVRLETVSPDELVQRLYATSDSGGRDFDAALVEFSQGRYADPDPYPFWHDSQIESGQNFSGYTDRAVSEALEIARKDPNGVRRAELYRSFQERFVETAAAVLLYNPLYHYSVSCQVQGVQLMIFVDPSDRYRNLDQWRIVPPDQLSQVCPNVSAP